MPRSLSRSVLSSFALALALGMGLTSAAPAVAQANYFKRTKVLGVRPLNTGTVWIKVAEKCNDNDYIVVPRDHATKDLVASTALAALLSGREVVAMADTSGATCALTYLQIE